MTVKLSQERKVRSLAKKTFGSRRVGSAMRLPGVEYRVRGVVLMEGGGGEDAWLTHLAQSGGEVVRTC